MPLTRRKFLSATTGAAAFPITPLWRPTWRVLSIPRDLAGPLAEQEWDEIRRLFPVAQERGTYLNSGTLGIPPYRVLDAVIDHLRITAAAFRSSDYSLDRLKETAAGFIGAAPHEIVITRNATEAMNFVANGLPLEPGDEILSSDHEHVGGLSCWQLIATRRRLTLTTVRLPVPPRDPADVLDAFRAAVTPRTRVISLSHVTFTTGLRTPVEELSRFCRDRGIVFVVDGAHPVGMFPVNVREIGADFYATSTHKWLCAPQGTGLLHIREDWLDRLWPTIASEGWNDTRLRSDRFNHLGTVNDSLRAGLQAAFELQSAIGPERIWRRVLELSERLYGELVKIPGLAMNTTRDPRMASGMVAFTLETVPALEIQRRLWDRGPVRTRVIGEYDYQYLRLSTHIFNTREEIDRTVQMIDEIARKG